MDLSDGSGLPNTSSTVTQIFTFKSAGLGDTHESQIIIWHELTDLILVLVKESGIK